MAFDDPVAASQLSIRRLLLLTAYVALVAAAFRYRPVVGVLFVSLVPYGVLAAYCRRPVSKSNIALFALATIPFYFASSGPACAFVEIIRRSSPTYYSAAWRIEAGVFPNFIFRNPDWIPSRRLIAYNYAWYELAEEWHDVEPGETSVATDAAS